MKDKEVVVSDLLAEGSRLGALLADLTPGDWQRPTPAPGWTVAHQVAHMAATFRLAALSGSDPAAFRHVVSQLSDDFDDNVDKAMAGDLALPPEELLPRWKQELTASAEALAAVPAGTSVPWLVRPLPAVVLVAAGVMELFAHGQDIADGIGVQRTYHDSIRHLVDFALLNWDFGYQVRGETPPDAAFRYELTAPSGEVWILGNQDSPHTVSGPAVDFCLLVTRRRHRDDLAVTASSAVADHWLDIAQAYRGPAGPGRRPGQFSAAPTG